MSSALVENKILNYMYNKVENIVEQKSKQKFVWKIQKFNLIERLRGYAMQNEFRFSSICVQVYQTLSILCCYHVVAGGYYSKP